MLRLKCLTCCGCQTKSLDDIFFDNDKKRPLFIECGHSMCSKCLPTFPDCPICNKPLKQTENYSARAIYDSCTSNPVLVFKNWFHAKVDEPESCSRCFNSSGKLRMCITCELSLGHLNLYTLSNDGSPWEDYGQIAYHESLRKKHRYSTWVENPIDRNRTRLKFRTMFHFLSNRLFCSDCICEEHDGHVVKTLKELEYSESELKQSSSFIASNFLWRTFKEWDSKCLLKKMKMLRICEKLEHLAVHWFPNPNQPAERKEINMKNVSKVNKFFESMDYESDKIIPLEEGDRIITVLEKVVQSLDVNENCECQEVWDEMHRLHFGNQIEKYFVEIINRMENSDTPECFFSSSEIEKTRRIAREMSNMKLFKIYTAFCWDYKKKKLCGIFNDQERRPCMCPYCKVSTCQSCLREYSRKCSFCGRNSYNYETRNREYNVDSGVLELIDFYKNKCVGLFEKWWKCESSELGFCLSCSSYSDQLEVCVFCELHKCNTKLALRTRPISLSPSEYRQNMKLFFDFKGLASFPMRWQCAHCQKRLEADWMHKECRDCKYDNWKGNWSQGCNHLINRVYDRRRCTSYNARNYYHEYNAISLKDIDGYDAAMKVAAMGLVLIILKAGIMERVGCRLWKVRMLNIYGNLNGRVHDYFRKTLYGRRPNRMETAALKISVLIEHLGKEWNNYKTIENLAKTCDCNSVWNNADQILRKKLKEVSNCRMDDVIDRCPLSLDHGIDIGQEMA